MKPLSPGAQRSLEAYRHAHSVPPAVRARLLAGLERALPAEQAALPVRSLRVRGLRLLRWCGSLAVLLAAVGLSLRPEARPLEDAAPPGQAVTAAPAPVVSTPAAAPPVEAPAPPVQATSPKRAHDERPAQRGAARKAPKRSPSGAENERASSVPAVAVAPPAKATQASEAARLAPELGSPAEARASTAAEPPAAQAEPARHESGGFERDRQRSIDAPRPELSLDDEVMLLRRVSDHLTHGDPMRAMSAIAEHARLFPNGKLVAMRKAARVRALCELDKRTEAEREAKAFLAQYGDSSYAVQVRRGCQR